jgi:hypothetical protein
MILVDSQENRFIIDKLISQLRYYTIFKINFHKLNEKKMANDGKYRVANPDHFDSDTNFYSNLDLDLDPGPTSHFNSDPDPYCFMYRVFPS